MSDSTLKKGLSSVGVKVEIGSSQLHLVTDLGDIKNEKNPIDVTNMLDEVEDSIDGVGKSNEYEIKGFYHGETGSDYAILKAAETAGTASAIVVTTPDGFTHTNSGIVSEVSISDVKVNGALTYSAKIKLKSKWADAAVVTQ